MNALTYTGELVIHGCPVCGIVHAIPSGLDQRAKLHGASVICPLGHSWIFTRTVDADLRERTAELRHARQQLASAREDVAAAARSAAAYKGAATKARRRAAAGQCPVCDRTFVTLRSHVRKQHPEFNPEDLDG